MIHRTDSPPWDAARPRAGSLVPFAAGRGWVKRLFDDGGEGLSFGTTTTSQQDDSGFVVASLLVEHGALHVPLRGLPSPHEIDARRATLIKIADCLALPWPKGLVRAASLVGVPDPGLRRGRVLIRSETSVLANMFHPPLPEHLKSSCEELGLNLVGQGKMSPIERALVASMVLLTLHPFADGNGRTARHLFIAWLLRHGITDPTHVSALAGCFSGGSLRLQLALKALRLGSTSHLFSLYSEGFYKAGVEASGLHAALPFGSVGGQSALEALRQHLSSQMH